jgi:hypothetical protein
MEAFGGRMKENPARLCGRDWDGPLPVRETQPGLLQPFVQRIRLLWSLTERRHIREICSSVVLGKFAT